MRYMNRRLALTVAGSTALVVITAGAAVAANLGILTASPNSGVGQLDATRVAELAVSTPASIAATQPAVVVLPAESAAGPGLPLTAQEPAPVGSAPPRSSFSAPVTPAAEVPATVETPAPTPVTPTTHVEYEDEDEELEGSLDDHVQDDSFLIESPHQVEEVHVSERIR